MTDRRERFFTDRRERFEEMTDRRERFAVIHVKATPDWLTADGECTEEEGWQEIEKLISSAIRSSVEVEVSVKAKFLEWDEVPRE